MSHQSPVRITLALSLFLICLAPMALAADGARQYYELRIYTFDSEAQQAVVEDYWEQAAVPALNRLGIAPVGVFKELEATEEAAIPRILVLIPYTTLEQFDGLDAKLAQDAAYQKAAAPYLNAGKEAPAYARIESNLLQALEVKPMLQAPDTSKPRIFEMREYQGHSETANALKIAMFNDAEADIFAESGLTAVFFSKTLIGKNRPSLFYMVTFDDLADHEKDWGAFRENPRWAAIRQEPKYADGGVSARSVYMLQPARGSQI